jgi:phosphoglycerol transferase MdoB-like AlkP superfamily enzyme
MLQRVQTIYFIIVMAILSSLLSGIEIFAMSDGQMNFSQSVFGVESSVKGGHIEWIGQFEYAYLFVIAYVMLVFLAMMSYKSLKRQYTLSKIVLFIYVLFVLAILAVTSFGINGYSPKEITGIHVGIGFYLLVCGLPFTYFAMKGVQKDKGLLDSLNRLR